MIGVKENFALIHHNTFQVPAQARFFVELNDLASVQNFLATDLASRYRLLILGGGSNVLFTKDFDGVVAHPEIKGMEIIQEDSNAVIIRAGAGENWDSFVEFCVNNKLVGIENLSFIPGTVGACPVQNIGAYGVEVMDYIESVEGFLVKEGKPIRLKAKDCQFSYRNSIFKAELKDKVLITQVNFKLSKMPTFNTNYPDLQKELDNYTETTLMNIRRAIITIRTNKLPDPTITGNAGSFFKNPIIHKEQADSLRQFYPGMPVYDLKDGAVKLSAAWLIEKCGWKGRICGKVGTHKKQPLIIINRGGATGADILHCAQKIQKSVMNHFAIKLEMEVNIL
jgi:UDP-N-acetylmuramate dehydrogenase